MTNSAKNAHGRDVAEVFPAPPLWLVPGTVGAIVTTSLVSVSDASLGVKAASVTAIIAVLLLSSWVIIPVLKRRFRRSASDELLHDRVLRSLDDAGEYFARSLTVADALRLSAGQIGMIAPVARAALYLVEGSRVAEAANVVCNDETDNPREVGKAIPDVVRSCLRDGEVCYERAGRGRGERQRVSVPLWRNAEIFGVLTLEVETAGCGRDVRVLFGSIGSHLAPLILSSLSFERSRASAMTDAITDLPSERAFHLILENQIAESQRNAEARPLSVLAISVQDLDVINKRYGHAAGDRVLNFVSRIVKDSLRQMDFFARSGGSEFLTVLPTATREVSIEIMDRIHGGFAGRELEIAEGQCLTVELNIGCASFGLEGETASQMLSAARASRDRANFSEPAKVLRFPGYESRA